MKTLSLSLLALLLLTPSFAGAEPASTTANDEQTIRENVAKYVDAFNRGDAAAIGELFASDAVFVNLATGAEWKGRPELEKQLTALFATKKQGILTITSDAIRVVSPTIALQRGIARVTRDDMPPQESVFAVVNVKRDGQWLMSRATDDLTEAAAAGSDQLKELGWMVGSWMYEGENEIRVETTVQWVDGKNFLQRTSRVFQGKEAGPTGTELIAFDPASNSLHSYVTNSDGSHGEGVWTQNGDRWVVEQTAVLANGEKFSATETYRFVNDNAYVWQATNRVVAGQREPDTREVLVARTGSIDTTSDAD
ncbi:MAG: SgcJ/EcaC family oxidoreductase [Planctomycetes bacterium]|nr:SgcJ/EcaC family oxidoreductase [Planctomycetota bacterium]